MNPPPLKHRQKNVFILVLIYFVIVLSSCAHYRYFPSGNIQVGEASWYGTDFHGKKTANAETYDMYDLTAAHRTLPFGSVVLVTNLKNKKSVKVRINDRGPFVKGRIIDLSYSAAKAIDMIGPGVAPVRIEVLQSVSSERAQYYAVQVGSFMEKKNAKKLKRVLQYKYRKTYIMPYETSSRKYFRVRIPARNRKHAARIEKNLQNKGYSPYILEESRLK